MTSPKAFERVLTNYAPELRLRYRQATQTWCVEIIARNTESSKLDDLRAVFHAKANRELHPGMNAVDTEEQLFRRLEAKARLEALNNPEGPARIRIFMPYIGSDTCEEALATLKSCDTFAKGRLELGDGINAAANRISEDERYQDEFEERRRRERMRRDMRDAGGEAWERKGYLEGSRISMAGV